MSKPLSTLLLAFAGFIMIAGIALYALRNPLVEALIGNQLSKQGIPLQSVAVLEVSPNSFHLQDLTAGTHQELRIGKMLVTWDFLDLLAGKPLSIEISGLQIMLDLNEAHPLWSARPPKTSSTQAGSGTMLPWLPVFSLRDSAIRLRSAAGDLTIALAGDIGQSPLNHQAIRFSAIAAGPLGQARAMLTATLAAHGNIQGQLTVSEGMLNLPDASISSFGGEATFVLAAMHPQQIHAEFVLSDIALLGQESIEPVSQQANKRLTPSALPRMGIDRITFKGAMHPSIDAWTGKLDVDVAGGQVIAGPLHIQQASLSLPMQVNVDQDTWRLGLRSPAQVTLGKIDSMAAGLKGLLEFSIPQANFESVASLRGRAFTHDIVVIPTNFNLLAQQAKSPPIEGQIHPGKITLRGMLDAHKKYQGQFAIIDTAFLLPQLQVQAKDISAKLQLGATEADHTADFTIGQLRHLAPKPLFTTLSFSGSLKHQAIAGKPSVYALNGTGGVPGLRYLKLMGQHAPWSGNGMLTVEIAPLKFLPNSLQPDALSPVLASLEDVSGLVNANAQIKWTQQGVHSSQGSIDLKNVSFVHEAARISDLNVTLNLNNLLPPSSLPQQTIKIHRIDSGIPLENLWISYHIEGADLPRIALEKAQFSMMDGLVSLEPTIIDPASARSDVLIHINNIDLATFFALIQVEGLAGTGHLDGAIPITVEGNQMTIKDSHLAAKAPGILRFKSEKASQLLADTGEEMNLLLQAMQDFHYTELSLHLDKSATHDLVAKLSLLGSNPAVKEGQVFRLNIKLESNIDKILNPIRQGYNLSNEILRGSFRYH